MEACFNCINDIIGFVGGYKIIFWIKIKQELRKNKAFALMFIINIVLFFVDFFTTWLNRDIVNSIEVNPLFQLSGSLILPVLFNFIWFVCVYWLYTNHRATPTLRFLVIFLFGVMIILRLYAINNALSWSSMEPVAREVAASAVTVAEKQSFLRELFIWVAFPMLYVVGMFKIWLYDHIAKRRYD